MLDATLQPSRYGIVAETPDDIVADLNSNGVARNQAVRSTRKNWLDQADAAGAIDGIVAAALEAAGADVAQTIRRMRETVTGFIYKEGGHWLNLYWDDGLINASFRPLEGVSYREGRLTFDKEAAPSSTRGLIGKPARSVVDSAVLEGRGITAVGETCGKLVITVEPRYQLFDADGCHPQDRLFPL